MCPEYILVHVRLATLFAAGALFAAEHKGWISDAACGWNNARPGKEAKECAFKCVREGGWAPVFVKDGLFDALKVSSKDKVMPFAGDYVAIDGEIKTGLIDIRSVRKLPAPPPKPKK